MFRVIVKKEEVLIMTYDTTEWYTAKLVEGNYKTLGYNVEVVKL
jgi:hypothetical protein